MLPILYLLQLKTYKEKIPTVNLTFGLEPRWFARIRWGLRSKQILEDAHTKFQGGVYRLVRGDTNLIVLPHSLIPELNRLPPYILNSRDYHSFSVLGHITGLDTVRKTNHHLKVMLGQVGPALPHLNKTIGERVAAAITRCFPQQTDTWTALRPLDRATKCVTEGIVVAVFGRPVCNNPKLNHECYQLATDAFTIVMILRFVPSCLHPFLGWLLPAKWRLRRSWNKIDEMVVSEVKHRQQGGSASPKDLDFLSWMATDDKSVEVTDPHMLVKLAATIAVGGIYSMSNTVVGVIDDLVAHPEVLEEVRNEIQEKHNEINGKWDFAAINSLQKLESVIKETTRLAPGSLLVYSRVMKDDHTLSNGVSLRKGQTIAMPAHVKSMDPEVFPSPETYDGLRHYRNLDSQHTRPFISVDGNILTWGAGRSACPGRFIANTVIRIALVKLLDAYEFKFVEGRSLQKLVCHEFVLFNPFSKIMVRKREHSLGIEFE
ncbi:putative cytochrome P450 [Daldinia vernicosa]|uniref:putative cytochrome P450 n=1 Tax=Daldinia vernicosa TaxID=114800 RepID=UPI0020079C03|nr:putative cytochrome P450 [Daldinia vernicosa]KAI0847853.1 putative cytochrome P450 [Daldinia vernicosa]